MLCFVLSCTGVYSGWGASLAVNLETFSIGQVTPYRLFCFLELLLLAEVCAQTLNGDWTKLNTEEERAKNSVMVARLLRRETDN